MELQDSLPSYKLQNSTGYYVTGYATDLMGNVQTFANVACGTVVTQTHTQGERDVHELAAA